MILNIQQDTTRTETVNVLIIEALYNIAKSGTNTVSLQGRLYSNYAYDDAVEYLNAKFSNLTIDVPSTGRYIRFHDSEVERLCIANWGSGNYVTTSLLAGVTSLGTIFRNNTTIQDFTEFKYFTGVTDFSNALLYDSGTASNVTSITFPKTEIKWGSASPIKGNSWNMRIPLVNIDFNGCTLSPFGTALSNHIALIDTVVGFDYYDGIIPNQTNIPRMFNRIPSLTKMIYPEGVISTDDNFNACGVKYLEFPTSILDVGILFEGFERDANSSSQGLYKINANTAIIAIKAVTPPTFTLIIDQYTIYPAALYVPDNSVNAYKAALSASTTWQNLVLPMSNLINSANASLGTCTAEDAART